MSIRQIFDVTNAVPTRLRAQRMPPWPSAQSTQATWPEKAQAAGVHPMVLVIALGATLLGLVPIWMTFAWGRETGYLLGVVTLFSVIFFTVFLLTSSYTLGDPRWRQRELGFERFLKQQVAIGGGKLPGREVVAQIILLPVALAFAFAAIGLVWAVLH